MVQTDADGIGDSCDNCMSVANHSQTDSDSDSIGGACEYICDDAYGEGTINIADAVYLISYVFSHGSASSPLAAGDADCDGSINIADAVYLVAYIFSHGPQPCAGCK